MIESTTLNNGTKVLAKTHKSGNVFAIGYANRTQATRRAATIPGAWVGQFRGRSFYVVLPE